MSYLSYLVPTGLIYLQPIFMEKSSNCFARTSKMCKSICGKVKLKGKIQPMDLQQNLNCHNLYHHVFTCVFHIICLCKTSSNYFVSLKLQKTRNLLQMLNCRRRRRSNIIFMFGLQRTKVT